MFTDINEYVKRVNESAEYIKNNISEIPQIAIVLGSGLDVIADSLENPKIMPYSEIPNFPVSTAPGHKGQLMFGKIQGKNVLLMSGRFHYYEGYAMKEVTFPVRVMKEIGIKTLIITNAAGGLNPDFKVGNPCIITDHINYFGDNPLIGQNNEEWGPRFPDMTECYSRKLSKIAKEAADKLSIEIHHGVYLGITGPTFETPSELRMMRNFGADLVGMSTIPEVIVARHSGIETLGFSAVTDRAVPDDLKPVTGEEVIEIARNIGKKIAQIIMEVIKTI